jgi:hypothetical protein
MYRGVGGQTNLGMMKNTSPTKKQNKNLRGKCFCYFVVNYKYYLLNDFMLCSIWVEIRPSDAISLSRDSVLHAFK